jgi:hypothetical protein
MIEATRTSETSVLTSATLRNVPEDGVPYNFDNISPSETYEVPQTFTVPLSFGLALKPAPARRRAKETQPQEHSVEKLRAEMENMFQDLSQQLLQSLTQHLPHQQEPPDKHPDRPAVMEDLLSAPAILDASWPKIFKLAKELKRRAAPMTAGRDLHDIHTVLLLVAHWDQLVPPPRNYTAHGLQLLYIAVTKGWPGALFCDQQRSDLFLDVAPEFWATYQPAPRPRAAQRAPTQGRCRSSTHRARTKAT